MKLPDSTRLLLERNLIDKVQGQKVANIITAYLEIIDNIIRRKIFPAKTIVNYLELAIQMDCPDFIQYLSLQPIESKHPLETRKLIFCLKSINDICFNGKIKHPIYKGVLIDILAFYFDSLSNCENESKRIDPSFLKWVVQRIVKDKISTLTLPVQLEEMIAQFENKKIKHETPRSTAYKTFLASLFGIKLFPRSALAVRSSRDIVPANRTSTFFNTLQLLCQSKSSNSPKTSPINQTSPSAQSQPANHHSKPSFILAFFHSNYSPNIIIPENSVSESVSESSEIEGYTMPPIFRFDF